MTIIGIIGGMGPEATSLFFNKLVKSFPAKSDQEHPKVIVYNNPKIPDRTKAILGEGEDPTDAIIETGRALGTLGVTISCIPCITAHYYFDKIQDALPFPIINAITESEKYIKQSFPGVRRLGILATTGTIQSESFNKFFLDHDILYPQEEYQQLVMEAIYGTRGIKSNNFDKKSEELLLTAGKHLINQGADLLIAGCTELPLVLNNNSFSVPIIDPMEVVVQTLIQKTRD